MTTIKYTGTSDAQRFGPEDFIKAGVETTENYSFAQGQPTEVPTEIASVLTSNEGIFGRYLFEETEPLPVVPETSVDPAAELQTSELEVVDPLGGGTPMGPMVVDFNYEDASYDDLRAELSRRNENRDEGDEIKPVSQKADDIEAALKGDDQS